MTISKFKIGDIIERRAPASDFVVGIVIDDKAWPSIARGAGRNASTVLAINDTRQFFVCHFWEYILRDYYMLSFDKTLIALMKRKHLEYQLIEIIEK